MIILNQDIGTSKDNLKMPIHNWYRFTAGFSYKLVDEIITMEKLSGEQTIYEPFAGCGTTLVTAQKRNIRSVGNESQKHMYEVIKGKTNWDLPLNQIAIHLDKINELLNNSKIFIPENTRPLLTKLYTPKRLTQLYLLKDYIENMGRNKCYYFMKLALSQTLHKVSKYPIAAPYISWNKKNRKIGNVKDIFFELVKKMLEESMPLKEISHKCVIHRHDSRKVNRMIDDNTCNVCITSPPYLNNLDYGEVSKVHTYFYNYTHTWSDITKLVRKNLVTAATTHYTEREFDIEQWKDTQFYNNNTATCQKLIQLSNGIKKQCTEKGGKKSFDILILKYFNDMFQVLVETKRVLKKGKPAYIILGDSAPYGVHIPTTEILGKIALTTGFKKYAITKIRTRGNKWKGLKFRHNQELNENLLYIT